MINLERTVHADVPLSFGLLNEYDSGNPFYLDTEKAVTVKMRADVPMNLCTN